MNDSLYGLRIGLLDRPSRDGDQGRLVETLIPVLHAYGARVDLVDADQGLRRLDEAPPWAVTVLKSGAPAALHLASAAESWGIPSLNGSEATRLAQNRLAVAAILSRAGLPVPHAHLAWLDRPVVDDGAVLKALEDRPRIIKAARGSRGSGLWRAPAGELRSVAAMLQPGPYLIMEWVEHAGDDLKVFVAGEWLSAITRPFPATTIAEKRGRVAEIPPAIEAWTRAAGRLLGLTCYGCDFIRGADGWVLVDVNAFPGYKGAFGAPAAIAAEIGRVARARGGGST